MFLRPFGLYCSACFGSLFVSILCTLPTAIKSPIVRTKRKAEKRDEKLSYSLGARVKANFAEVRSC